jgi:PKD repeat protein
MLPPPRDSPTAHAAEAASIPPAASSRESPQPASSLPGYVTWANLTGTVAPPGRYSAAMVYDGFDGYVLLFGGGDPSSGAMGDTWAYVSGQWSELCSGSTAPPACASEPPPSVRGAMTYDPILLRVVYYDWGVGATWTFQGGSWKNITKSVHPGSQGFPSELAYSPSDRGVVLFTSDGHTWNLTRGNWSEVRTNGSGPPARVGARLFFDPGSQHLILYGGVAGAQVFNDVWSYSNRTWTRVPVTSGPPGSVANAYDAGYGFEALLAPAAGGGGLAFWAFSAGHWNTLGTGLFGGGPAKMLAPSMTFDAFDGYLVLFSGVTSSAGGTGALPTTWGLVDAFGGAGLALTRNPVVVGDLITLEPNAMGGVRPYSYEYTALVPGCHPFDTPVLRCPTYLPGSFHLAVNVSDGRYGSVSLSTTVTIVPQPIASFSASLNPTTVGIPVHFSATVLGGLPPFLYRWSFDDRGTATGVNSTHVYRSAGAFNVSLNVFNATNVSTGSNAEEFVNVGPLLRSVRALPNVTDVGIPVTFAAVAIGGTAPFRYTWVFGNGIARASAPALAYPYPGAGTFRAKVWANDSVGASTFRTVVVTVHADPVVQILTDLAPYNLSVTLRVALAGGTGPFAYVWALGDGSVNATADVTHVYPAPGNYQVTVVVRDSAGWSVSQELTIAVNPQSPPTEPLPWYDSPLGLVVLLGGFGGFSAGLFALGRWSARRREEVPDAPVDAGFEEELAHARNALEAGVGWEAR